MASKPVLLLDLHRRLGRAIKSQWIALGLVALIAGSFSLVGAAPVRADCWRLRTGEVVQRDGDKPPTEAPRAARVACPASGSTPAQPAPATAPKPPPPPAPQPPPPRGAAQEQGQISPQPAPVRVRPAPASPPASLAPAAAPPSTGPACWQLRTGQIVQTSDGVPPPSAPRAPRVTCQTAVQSPAAPNGPTQAVPRTAQGATVAQPSAASSPLRNFNNVLSPSRAAPQAAAAGASGAVSCWQLRNGEVVQRPDATPPPNSRALQVACAPATLQSIPGVTVVSTAPIDPAETSHSLAVAPSSASAPTTRGPTSAPTAAPAAAPSAAITATTLAVSAQSNAVAGSTPQTAPNTRPSPTTSPTIWARPNINFMLIDQLSSTNPPYSPASWADLPDSSGKVHKDWTCLSATYAMVRYAEGDFNYRIDDSTYLDTKTGGTKSLPEITSDIAGVTIEFIRDQISKGNPVILHSKANSGSHYVLAIGIDSNGQVVANDPYGGRQIHIDPVTWTITDGRLPGYQIVGYRRVAFHTLSQGELSPPVAETATAPGPPKQTPTPPAANNSPPVLVTPPASQPSPTTPTSTTPAPIASALRISGFLPNYTSSSRPYAPTIQLSGSGFLGITEIRWTYTPPGGQSSAYVWTSDNWSGKFNRAGDTSATVTPGLLASNDGPGTYSWTVTFFGTGGQQATIPFTVTYISPPAPVPAPAPAPAPQPVVNTPPPPQSPVPAPVVLRVDGFTSYTTLTRPYQPTIALTGSGLNGITEIRWTYISPGGASGTVVWNSSNWSSKFNRYSDASASVTPVLVASTDPAGLYQWSVTFSAGGQSVSKAFSVTYAPPAAAPSTPAAASAPNASKPDIPSGVSPGTTSSPGASVTGTSVTLHWNVSSGATQYGLGVRDLTTNLFVANTAVNGTSYTVTGLVVGRTYRWNVDACNAAGCSDYTTAIYFTAR